VKHLDKIKPKVRMKIKKNDTVIVVKGSRKERGKTGRVIRILRDKERVVVEKVNFIKEYVRPNPQKNIQGGIVEREGPLPLSSVLFDCKECEQGVRIGYRYSDENATPKRRSKQRICRKCGVVLD